MTTPNIVAAGTDKNAPVAKEVKPIDTVRNLLEKMKPQFMSVLPSTINAEQFVRIALTPIQQTPKLLNCDMKSLIGALMRSAQLGLEPSGLLGQAYLIPYGNTVQFIVGYKGLIDLARRSGEVSNIITREVRKNDDFKIQWHESPPFIHNQKAEGDRGEVIGFWALANFKDGGYHWDYMTVQEITEIRDQSSGWQSAKKYNKTADHPWNKHFNEMAKKTIIRRIAKYLPMSVQKATITENLSDAGKSYTFDASGEVFTIDDDVPTIDGAVDNVTEQKAIPAEKPVARRKAKEEPVAPAVPEPAPVAQPAVSAEAPCPYVAPVAQQPAAPEANNDEDFGFGDE